MMLPTNFEVKDETDGDDSQGQDELEELRKTVQGCCQVTVAYLQFVLYFRSA